MTLSMSRISFGNSEFNVDQLASVRFYHRYGFVIYAFLVAMFPPGSLLPNLSGRQIGTGNYECQFTYIRELNETTKWCAFYLDLRWLVDRMPFLAKPTSKYQKTKTTERNFRCFAISELFPMYYFTSRQPTPSGWFVA